MIEVHSPSLNRRIEVDRIIGHIEGSAPGPTVVFLGGVHGNESSGVFALHQVTQQLMEQKEKVRGHFYAISGNMQALKNGQRYCLEDLNRLWTSSQLEQLTSGSIADLKDEYREQAELFRIIQKILYEHEGPFYFMDLHTTSSETIPFVVVNDSLLNRRFAEQFPVPMILGIEEYLDGPILSYINELGYVSFGYEAGQHQDLASYQNQVAFIFLCLVFSESMLKGDIEYYHYYEQLAKTSITSRDIFEIRKRYQINNGDQFNMNPGYVNFQKVSQGEGLAISNGKTVMASHNGRVFMPLYQDQGKEGFFEIGKIHPFFLRLSAMVRKTKIAHILPFLPGIRWQSARHHAMVVNLKIARFLAKPLLHLLGYRTKQIDTNHLIIKNREAASRSKEYTAAWNQ